jgi:hypothetical protein
MLEQTGPRRRVAWGPSTPPIRRRRTWPEGPEARIEALTKLKSLFDAGVLTPRQYTSERDRLLGR